VDASRRSAPDVPRLCERRGLDSRLTALTADAYNDLADAAGLTVLRYDTDVDLISAMTGQACESARTSAGPNHRAGADPRTCQGRPS
jgi:hypothetical protein